MRMASISFNENGIKYLNIKQPKRFYQKEMRRPRKKITFVGNTRA